MALSSRQKKQGAVVSAAVGALALGGVAVSTLGSSATDAARPVAAQAAPPIAASSTSSPAPSSSSSATITIKASADNTKPTDDTVFTVSGTVTGAQPGAKIRLQRQAATPKDQPWGTLAYTTFTDKSNKFSFLVKLEDAGSFNLRILHPSDREGPTSATSDPFAVTVTSTTPPKISSSSSSKASTSSPTTKKS